MPTGIGAGGSATTSRGPPYAACAGEPGDQGRNATSLAGFISHLIWSMPSDEALMVTSATTVSSRETSRPGRPFASTHVTVAPGQSLGANAVTNLATRVRPSTRIRATPRTAPPPSE